MEVVRCVGRDGCRRHLRAQLTAKTKRNRESSSTTGQRPCQLCESVFRTWGVLGWAGAQSARTTSRGVQAGPTSAGGVHLNESGEARSEPTQPRHTHQPEHPEHPEGCETGPAALPGNHHQHDDVDDGGSHDDEVKAVRHLAEVVPGAKHWGMKFGCYFAGGTAPRKSRTSQFDDHLAYEHCRKAHVQSIEGGSCIRTHAS